MRDDLDVVCREIWRLVGQGVTDPLSPWRLPALATIGLDGAPQLRTVVLRACDPLARTLTIHTDLRSAKIEQLQRDSRVAIHVYDAVARIQLRLSGCAEIHPGQEAGSAAWSMSRLGSRAGYAVHPGPGTAIASGDAYAMPADDAAISAGIANFAALVMTIATLEWVHLHADGHRRALFDWRDGRWQGQWLVP